MTAKSWIMFVHAGCMCNKQYPSWLWEVPRRPPPSGSSLRENIPVKRESSVQKEVESLRLTTHRLLARWTLECMWGSSEARKVKLVNQQRAEDNEAGVHPVTFHNLDAVWSSVLLPGADGLSGEQIVGYWGNHTLACHRMHATSCLFASSTYEVIIVCCTQQQLNNIETVRPLHSWKVVQMFTESSKTKWQQY